MARRSPLARAWLWIGLGVLAALAVRSLAQGDGPPVSANIPGDALPLETKAGAAATPKAAAHAAKAQEEETKKPAFELPAKGPLVGDALLRGALALDKAEEKDGHYEVPLPDGNRAILTLDPDIQKAAEKVLERAKAPKAAAVVMSIDGRLLALAGRRQAVPAYDLPVTVWAPAASVFKLVTTTALLRAGFNPKKQTCFHGGLRGVDASHLVDSDRDHTCSSLGEALSMSENAVFAKLAHRHLNRRKLAKAAHAYGMDAAADCALEVEPNRFEIPKDPLEFAQVAAGFWKTRMSPLGAALLAGTIATGGLRLTPRVVDSIERKGGEVEKVEPVKPVRVVRKAIAKRIGKMMVATTDHGTAKRGFHDRRGRQFFKVDVAGKTGSLARDRPTYLGYSWFVGFAPADKPKVVIAVLLGNPARWYLKASTAARLVLAEIF